jgi:cellulose synthase/poly-beta-1,6-N-acetylglucosamine synthase-like glycosyltransferase
VPVWVLLLETLLALGNRGAAPGSGTRRPAMAILVPAHNEAGIIGQTLSQLLSHLAPGDRLLVVADNCSDNTASEARAAGAEVVERQDPARRGKGYALDFGVRHLTGSPHDVLIIMDADCVAETGALERIASRSMALDRPVQACYMMYPPPGAPLKMRIAQFAWIVKNRVRPLGAERLAMPCHFYGTGMALPWHLLKSLDFATGNLVEDMQIGIELAQLGYPVRFQADAMVISRFPANPGAVTSQRTRWEHGHLLTIAKEAPRLLGLALRRGDPVMLWLALDLSVPPLAMLALVQAGTLVLALVLALLGIGSLPLVISGVTTAALGSSVLLAWSGWARDILSLSDLLGIPAYIVGKLPLYGRFFGNRQQEWIRTERD